MNEQRMLQRFAYGVSSSTHFDVYRGGVACDVSGVARQRVDLTRRPDGPVAEGEGQREDAGGDEDDDDDELDPYDAEQLLGPCGVAHEHVAFHGQSGGQPGGHAQRRVEQVMCVRVEYSSNCW